MKKEVQILFLVSARRWISFPTLLRMGTSNHARTNHNVHKRNLVFEMKHFSLILFPVCAWPSFARRIAAPPHPLNMGTYFPPPPGYTSASSTSQQHRRRATVSSGGFHNLVIPIRFADHMDRSLPSRSDLDVLFNSLEGDEGRDVLAPTGSVRDVFRANSYNLFDVTSATLDWVNVSQTEYSAADRAYGMSPALLDSLYEALAIANVTGVDLDSIDTMTFMHSGYMAEWGGPDCFGTEESDRLWSHKWAVPPDLLRLDDCSALSAKMDSYVIASALFGKCGSDIARVGLLAHEVAHFLGLEDLYDTSRERKGRGLGSYDLMSDTWGLDYSQLYPPMLSPWTKIHLGWLEPTVIRENGEYFIAASEASPAAFRIDAGFAEGEYLLIENRQPVGFDALISQGGLAIYHVDEQAPRQKRRGHPLQKEWPENGNHYMIALLQADSLYELERGRNTGDKGDLWHADCGKAVLGPGRNDTHSASLASSYPNTDSYQSGVIKSTGIVISDFSESGEVMSFRIQSPNMLETHSRSEAVGRHNTEGAKDDVTSKSSILSNVGNFTLPSMDPVRLTDDTESSGATSGGSSPVKACRTTFAAFLTLFIATSAYF
mmetsp:Transcript_26759/g.59465  ORF Transcript_26759/g.59465 Transcript_26759/m.59465 type:complete len:603 (+) Transcript_26759:1348-3156(+)